MILDSIVTFIYNFVSGLLSPLDELNNVVIDPYITDSIMDFFKFVAYLIPLNRLWPIIAICLLIYGARFIIVFIKTVWELLPIL